MKYFGPKSLSSIMSTILLVAWVIVLAGTIIAPIVLSGVIFFSTPTGEGIGEAIVSGKFCGREHVEIDRKDYKIKDKDRAEWNEFKKMPLGVKFLILPYVVTVMVLLLHIIKRARLLFTNFKNNIVFNKSNVLLISTLAKLLIAYSIITFSFSSLLLSVVLLLLCEIIKSGTTLQEELELTV
jgi:flagellin-like protein